jgi:hypothetical protein
MQEEVQKVAVQIDDQDMEARKQGEALRMTSILIVLFLISFYASYRTGEWLLDKYQEWKWRKR